MGFGAEFCVWDELRVRVLSVYMEDRMMMEVQVPFSDKSLPVENRRLEAGRMLTRRPEKDMVKQ